jgi:hypothetical protein
MIDLASAFACSMASSLMIKDQKKHTGPRATLELRQTLFTRLDKDTRSCQDLYTNRFKEKNNITNSA